MFQGGAKKTKKTSPRKGRSASPKKAKGSVAKKTKSASPKKAKRSVAKKAKSTTPKKTKKSKGKRGLNPYMKFVKATRAAVVKANPKAGITEIAKKLGEMWRKMTDGEKSKYK